MKKELQVYNAGHILNEAMVDYRNKQAKEINSIEGIKCYNVLDDKSINDKANAEQTGLAERILANDFKAMHGSDIFVFDVLNEGLGTIAELGIILGMKHQAQETIKQLEETADIFQCDFDGNVTDTYEILWGEIEELKKILDKPVLCYCSDIRQGHGKPYLDPDRAELSTNQFVYGMVLELTRGEGFTSWEEVKERLAALGSEANV
ncbi:nucleoside 2-deoxyribosyltransferase [Mammaliicoccus sciuri]|uniref:nucleoside 2-deoxyribosyltransferase n=1 Tax=Mammaliicoccus sciuri TaxID=1296 RepID=UPI002DBAE1D4|nr:nucleoside 2-deoxyribosyltransferase [Mammaliicoccus sciuri]MEB6232506.1 nucleoside 2-deoxyribosyltransferase [Mammaliicoccus sciuri]